MKIRKYKDADFLQVCGLIHSTYSRFCAKESSRIASKRYLDKFDVNKDVSRLRVRYNNSKIVFVCEEAERIVGVVMGDYGKLVNLYVLEKFHKRGIAKKLYLKFEKENLKNNVFEIKLGATAYAALFYEKMGFKKTTGKRSFRGLSYQPMKKVLN